MLAILPTAGVLPGSKSHAARRWAWQPTRDRTQPSLGTLTIVQGRRNPDSYGVDVASIGRGCRQVLFAKITGPADIYAVTCDPAGEPVACSCPGFSAKRTCKHVDATRDLIAEEILPDSPLDD